MNNLISYTLQIAAVVAAAAAIRLSLGIRMPAAKLVYWQALLAVCLALPFLRPWKDAAIQGTVTATTTVIGVATSPQPAQWNISWNTLVLYLIAAGIAFRLILLIAGFVRLHRLRVRSLAFANTPGVRISREVTGPVTFGFRHPVILLPANFPDLDSPVQEAILCHERLHIERRDWLFTVAEELIRALFWFHPAVWYLLSEIQLAREQVVDEGVIRKTRMRDHYVDALLKVSGADQPDLVPAPLFLRKRHLKQRLVSILKEVRMSRSRTYSALAAGLAVMAGLAWFVSGAIPMVAQTPVDSVGVTVDTGGAELIHRAVVIYPMGALKAKIEGTVVLSATLGPTGAVRDVTVLSGPEELRAAAVQSVRNWHYVREAAPVQQISIGFHIPSDSGVTIGEVQIHGLSDRAESQLREQLPVHKGDAVTPELMRQVNQSVAAFDEHLRATTNRTSDTSATLTISPNAPNGPIRIGGTVQQANLLTKVTPLYPPDAKAARVQGTVKLQVRISPEGQVEDVQLLDGPPLLVQSAISAVSQWTYRPTLLNGNPIEVLTTVDVNYTLSQ